MLFVQFDLNFNESCLLCSIEFFSLINSYRGVDYDSFGTSLFLELEVILLILLTRLLELLFFIDTRDGIEF